MNGPIQFVDSIFKPACFLSLRTSIFSPTSNFFDHFSGADGLIHDDFSDFAIATSNSLAKFELNAINSGWSYSTPDLGLILKSISKGDFQSVPGRLWYPPSFSARKSSRSRSLLLTKAFWDARLKFTTILSTFKFPLGL